MFELSSLDLQELLENRNSRMQKHFQGVSYDDDERALTISDTIFLGDLLTINIDNELSKCTFWNCYFPVFLLTAEHDSSSISVDFISCRINILSIVGNSYLSILVERPQSLEKLHVTGSLDELFVNGNRSGVVVNEIILETSTDDESQFIYARIVCQDSKQLAVKGHSFVQISDSVINLCTLNSVHPTTIIVEEQSFLKHFSVFNFSGDVSLNTSSIGILNFVGGDQNEGNGLFRASQSAINAVLVMRKAHLEKMELTNACSILRMDLVGGAIAQLDVRNSRIGFFNLDLSKFKFNQILVSGRENVNSCINHLLVRNGTLGKGLDGQTSTLNFADFHFSSIALKSFLNHGNFFISNLQGTGEKYIICPYDLNYTTRYLEKLALDIPSSVKSLEFINSDLGKTNFISCDFSELSLIFSGSKMTEVFLLSTNMPSIVAGDSQLAFGQLRKVYENRGDTIASVEYLKLELDAHYFSLLKRWSTNWRRRRYLAEVMTLLLNKVSNDFGTSWVRALMLLLSSMLVFYIAYIFSLDYSIGEWSNDRHRDNFLSIAALFPEFLYPLRKADYVTEALSVTSTNLARVIDFAARVWGGYLIYQFIQAFRKYGKK